MIEARIVSALLSAMWQSAVLAAFAAIALRLHGRTSATVRGAVWCGVLAVIVALPIVDFLSQRSVHVASVASVSMPGGVSSRASGPRVAGVRASAVRAAGVPKVAATEPRRAPPDLAALELAVAGVVNRIGAGLFWLWLVGSALCVLRLGYGLTLIAIMRRGLEPLAGDWLDRRWCPRRRVVVAAGERVAVPCLIGFLRPTIVIPRPLVEELRADDLRRIVLHEASHAQRYDDWTNLFVQLVRAVLFFNPIVHVLAARIGVEREIACDDRVIELSGDRLVYAECLSTMARAVSMRRAYAVPGFFGGRAQIVVRIEQLLDRAHDSSSRLGRTPAAAIAASAMLALLLAQVGFPVVAATPVAASVAREALPTPLHDVARQIPHAGAVIPNIAPLRTVERPRISGPAVVARAATSAHPEPKVVARVTPLTQRREDVRIVSVATRTRTASSSEGIAVVAARSPSDAASSDQPRDFVDELAAAGYRGLSVDQLIRLRDHGVDGTYLAGLRAAGYAGLSVEDVIRLRDHGVDPSYIGAMKRAGYGGLSAEDLIRLRDHGVDAETARALTASEHRRLTPEELITLRDHGVDSSYADAMAALGIAVPTDQMVKLRDHGVDPSFIESMRRSGYAGLSADQLIELRDHGVDANYVEHIRRFFSDGHKPTVGELVRLRDSGI
jgi:bla regulator protein blaR1